jgi:hypothetical protein
VDLIFSFVEGRAARHACFIEQPMKNAADCTLLHLKGVSGLGDTRWNCRASALRRLCTDRVFHAALDAIKHVSTTTSDGVVRGTAAGLFNSVNNSTFLVQLKLLTPVMKAVNNVSEALQPAALDILSAKQQVVALNAEMRRLRSDDTFDY